MKYTAKKRVADHSHAALKIALIACALLVVASVYGYSAARSRQSEPQSGAQPTQQAGQPAVAEPERLGVDGKVYLQVKYAKCGHTVETDVTDKAYVGMTQEELENQFSNAELQTFTKEKAVFLVETPSVCTLHYIVKYEEGKLNIYQPQEDNQEPKLYKSIEMETTGDPGLEEGIVFDSLEQVESYLENLES